MAENVLLHRHRPVVTHQIDVAGRHHAGRKLPVALGGIVPVLVGLVTIDIEAATAKLKTLVNAALSERNAR